MNVSPSTRGSTLSQVSECDVLVVEDEPAISEFMLDLLASEGYTVQAVSDGRSCLDLLKTVQPRIIMLDLLLPGISGLEVLKQYQQWFGYHAPVIMMTANRVNPETVINSGAAALLTKPFEVDLMFELIDKFIA